MLKTKKRERAGRRPRVQVARSAGGSTAKHVYVFVRGAAEGGKELKNLLGGKGANLAEMCKLGLPVPPGFTITTEVCSWFYAHGKSYPSGLEREVAAAVARLEREMGRGFGDAGD